ncbi:MAG TPA: hypothetical protein VEV87_01250 [Chitinophagaceae bacterium]|nr:hypothetical protein [Chitinophagaceae bacterium]
MKKEYQDQRTSQTDGAGKNRENDQFDTSKNDRHSQTGERNEDEFPGYPHYPPSEDIMNPANHIQRVSVDVENLAPTGSLTNQPSAKKAGTGTGELVSAQQSDDDIRIVPGTEADVTKEDLRLLNATEGSYADTPSTNTVTGEDLDIPGADQDDPNEDIGEEDEENNYYSIGGDNHGNLEEDPS